MVVSLHVSCSDWSS
nr:unnamed protein product [Callosobruchus analis]